MAKPPLSPMQGQFSECPLASRSARCHQQHTVHRQKYCPQLECDDNTGILRAEGSICSKWGAGRSSAPPRSTAISMSPFLEPCDRFGPGSKGQVRKALVFL